VFKPQVGDLFFMTLAVVAMGAMLLLGDGRSEQGDPDSERRTLQTYLRQINAHISPALTVALIIALSVVAYIFLGVYAKAT